MISASPAPVVTLLGVPLTYPAIISAIVGAIGVAAAVQQLTSWILRRKYEKAENRLLEILQQQVDAEEVQRFGEAVRQQVKEYERQQARLREQIEEEIPREARRLYTQQRLDALVQSLGRDYVEYEELRASQEMASGSHALPEEIRALIANQILPEYLEQKRRDRRTALLIVALVVLAFVPFDLASLVFYLVYRIFRPLSDAPWTAVPSYALLGLAMIVLLARTSLKPWSRRIADILWARRFLRVPVIYMVLALLFLLAIFVAAAVYLVVDDIQFYGGFSTYSGYDFSGSAQARSALLLIATTLCTSLVLLFVFIAFGIDRWLSKLRALRVIPSGRRLRNRG